MTHYSPLDPVQQQPKPATQHTLLHQVQVKALLPFADQDSFEQARRGFIRSLEPMRIQHHHANRSVIDLTTLEFLAEESPDTVNPSLWRQAQLTALHHGLFEVVEGIYQVRGFDIANMTLVQGDTGWIVIDPLTCAESSKAALDLANETLGAQPVVAIIHTHSHVDHFGGILGVTTREAVEAGEVSILAPLDFVKEALNENVLAGNVMGRRATYMYGNLLDASPTGFVSTGLGAALALGSTGFVPPSDIIATNHETRVIDGIEIEFQLTMGSEAPAEMVFFFPKFKALCMSEITSHHLHNVYTPRGAQVRDAMAWSNQIQESIDRFGDRLEVEFASHHWPTWGQEQAVTYLKKQRDLYRYIHDQTLRLANLGYGPDEIAEAIRLPKSLDESFHCRDYYGTVKHNAKAVYVKYLGNFDGNPANLNPHPPIARATRYVEAMGGGDAIMARCQRDFEAGDYRWVAEALNHLVMTDVDHLPARALLADTFEQMGYQAESGPWRNFYLCGALELREGLPQGSQYGPSAGMAEGMPLANLFEAMGVRLNGTRAAEQNLEINVHLKAGEPVLLDIENGVLHAHFGRTSSAAPLTIEATELAFKRLLLGLSDPIELIQSGEVILSGDAQVLVHFRSLFDQFERRFPIVTPRAALDSSDDQG
jgi:alkyl sulfatase BDS1-like metallo-beta-lactamase superfamily hydrolase